MIDTRRKIRIIGDIDHPAYLSFVKKIDRLEAENDETIHIELCSNGGDPLVALAFFDRIKASFNRVEIIATGMVASAAVLILVAGDVSGMTASSWVMVHEETPHPSEVKNKNITALEHSSKNYRRLEDQWNRLFSENTKMSFEQSQELHRNETYLTAEECFTLGIVQAII